MERLRRAADGFRTLIEETFANLWDAIVEHDGLPERLGKPLSDDAAEESLGLPEGNGTIRRTGLIG